MRFIITLFLVVFLISETLAGSVANKHKTRETGARSADVFLWTPSREQKYLLSGGYSSDFKYEGYLGVKGAVEYLISPAFSAGLEGGVYAGNTDFDWMRTIATGVRANYHFIPFEKRRNNAWNVYGGISGGTLFGAGGKIVDEIDPYLDIHAGARYLITNTWLVLGEVTTRSATIGLSLRL